ncbi:complex I NDUFA9 subunit family protein [Microvirga thermotolerans]|uniref:NAD-dependent epimerase/dehydratase family protein n=1 Tax=Microvirga thermotolerans TaxID=2651334 RepID=A0A5P9JS25_9HYPH|nr:complex I NDUFA9 subunit family protein [Microvirga thermotolerans]QFU14879.1 NAD-dependent epimerase/dehydratase family protein [Microvirga thermotolerans]
MIGPIRTPAQQLVTVFGGSGFLGRYVVSALAKRGYRIRIATRQPNRATLLPQGMVGQIHAVQANLRHRDSVAHAVAGADHVINLVGILKEGGRQRFDDLQAQGPRLIAELAPREATLVHISAIGADPASESAYARSKAAGEAGLFQVRPDAVVLRPSLMFGPGDSFFNRFAALARMLPVLPLAGADTRMQPVYAADVAEAIARAVEGRVEKGRVYECGGPEIRTFRELVQFVLDATERKRLILSLPAPAARMQGSLLGFLDRLTLGLMPDAFSMTRDQAILLETDNVVSEAAKAEGRTLEGMGILPASFEAIVPSYLVRFRKTGQFDLRRNTVPSPAPDLLRRESEGPAPGVDTLGPVSRGETARR